MVADDEPEVRSAGDVVHRDLDRRQRMGWDGWCKLHAEGHDVQSHTVNHLNTNSPTWHGPEVEYADLIKAIGAALPDTVPATDILGRLRSKTKPSIGPIEPSPGDKPFMAMWQTYFRQMQAAVQPPSPK